MSGEHMWSLLEADVRRQLAEHAAMPEEAVKSWVCPCCNEVQAMYIHGPTAVVVEFLSTTDEKTANDQECFVGEVKKPADIEDVARSYPIIEDRELIAFYLDQGLRDALRQEFAS